MKPAIFAGPLLVLALVVASTGCGGGEGQQTVKLTPAPTSTPTPVPTATPTPVPTVAYETHTDEASGFAIAYPRGWQRKTVPGVLLALTAAERCGGQDVTFSLWRIEVPPYSTDVESFFGSMISLTFSSPERSFISGEKVGVGGRAAIEWVSAFANYDGTPFKEASFYLLGGEAAWILSFTTVFSCWSQYEDAFDRMTGSFRLLP
jgi:hypothetical protein